MPQCTPGLRFRFTVLRREPLLIERLIVDADDIARRSTQSLICDLLQDSTLSPGRRPALEAGDTGFTFRIGVPEKAIYSS